MAFRGPERRLRTRFRVRFPMTLRNDNIQVQGMTRNISLLGVSAYADGSLPQAQPVHCLMELPNESKTVAAAGTVVHCEPLPQPHPDGSYEIGIFFKEFEERGESTLARYLEHISDKEESALKAGYRALKQKIAARKRRKRAEAIRKRRRRMARLRKKQRRLAKQKKAAAARKRKRSARRQKRS